MWNGPIGHPHANGVQGETAMSKAEDTVTNGHGPHPSGDGDSLIARGLRKSYSGRCVVDDLDLEVARGEVVGLLGANGAGKTTTFYMLVGLEPTEQADPYRCSDGT